MDIRDVRRLEALCRLDKAKDLIYLRDYSAKTKTNAFRYQDENGVERMHRSVEVSYFKPGDEAERVKIIREFEPSYL